MLTSGLICLFASPAAMAADNDWTQFQKNEQKKGFSVAGTPVKDPRPAWSKFVYLNGNTGIQNTAVVKGDTVYVFAGNRLMALNKQSGDTLWEKNIEGRGELQISTPAYGNGKLFIATFDGCVMAFDAISGSELWSTRVGQRNLQCPVTYHEGRIYIGEGGTGGPVNGYYCLNEEGEICWAYSSETAGYLWCGCAVAGNYLVFGNVDGVVTSLNKETGEVADVLNLNDGARIPFAQENPGKIRASTTYCDGYIYVSSENGIEKGYLWKIGFNPENGLFQNTGFCAAIGFSTSSPVVYNGRVYVGQGEHGAPGSFKCIDGGSGAVIWSYPVEMGVKSSPALLVREREVYIYFTTAMNDGFLYCLNGEGNLVWKYDLPDAGYIVQGAAVTDNAVFLGASGGYLYCFENESEWPSFQRDLNNSGVVEAPAPVVSPFVAWKSFTHYHATHGIDHPAMIADGKVFVLDVTECAWAFDLNSGEKVWSTQLTEGARFNLATPAYGDGKVFFAASTGHVYALDKDTGEVIWSGKITEGSYQKAELSAQVKYHEGKIYVGGWGGNYFCLDAAGKGTAPSVIWKYDNDNSFEWWSGAAVAGDFLLFGDGGSKVISLNKNTGAEVDKKDLSQVFGIDAGKICSAVCRSSETGRIYFTSRNGYVFSLGFDTVAGTFNLQDGWLKKYSEYSSSTPAVYNGKIYVCAGSFHTMGGLYCLRESDGAVIWKYEFTSGNYGSEASPAVAVQNGRAYIYFTTNCASGAAYCFDQDGKMLWEFVPDLPEYVLAGVAIAGGKVFFVNDAGYVYALAACAEEDVNCDGRVDVLDLIVIGQHFYETGEPGWIKADLNRDGIINVLDVIPVGQRFAA